RKDAKAIAKILEESYDFKVQLLLDPTRREILKALAEYRLKLTKKDNFLIYYAGHGWQDKDADMGYWLPSDAEEGSNVDWIRIASITSELRAMEANHAMIVADSCYSGVLTRGLSIRQKKPNYYDKMTKKKARVVLTSGGLEPVMDQGSSTGHSVFASAFLKALSENRAVLDGSELFVKIRRPIALNSNQTPEFSDIRNAGLDDSGGDFFFVRRK
ncbi:MAG: caspase family protein, partial [Magnetococcales bacterium]|nr:caspase family protein [Magnetococcales bacterium]